MSITRRLVVGQGRSQREIPLVGPIVIGRDPACQVSDPDPLLSRRHAEIAPAAEGASVRDLDSRNGVLVNGERTRAQVLRSGDVVQLGHLQIRYMEDTVQTPAGPHALRGRAAFEAAVDVPPAAGQDARAIANAELMVTDVTPRCADLLGAPAEALVGTSLPDLFVRSVRRAYADPTSALGMTIAQGPRGSIVVTFAMKGHPDQA
jgi:PAS domain-containing protein